jgi:hypothetical protein
MFYYGIKNMICRGGWRLVRIFQVLSLQVDSSNVKFEVDGSSMKRGTHARDTLLTL